MTEEKRKIETKNEETLPKPNGKLKKIIVEEKLPQPDVKLARISTYSKSEEDKKE